MTRGGVGCEREVTGALKFAGRRHDLAILALVQFLLELEILILVGEWKLFHIDLLFAPIILVTCVPAGGCCLPYA